MGIMVGLFYNFCPELTVSRVQILLGNAKPQFHGVELRMELGFLNSSARTLSIRTLCLSIVS